MSAKRRSRESSSLRRILLLLLLAVFLGGGVYLVWFSPVFKIQEIEIVGEELLVEYDLGEIRGANIIFWKPSFQLEESYRVAGAEIHKEYLKRKVIINLKARDRYLVWCEDVRDICYWVDESGFAFSEAPNFEGSLTLRLVRDSSGRELSLGDKVLEEELFSNLVLSIAFLEEMDIEAQEFVVGDLKFKEAFARVKNGPDVYFSLTLDPSFGKGVVKSLQNSGEWNTINYLDLRVPNRAYYNN
ncbi:hypothetical protein KKH05_02185 [Patescibacteria group bacterium]|nr:hypothetical protein [Patescibacteria group bacterium]